MGNFPINERLVVLIFIGFAIFALLMPNFFIGMITSPFKEDLKNSANINKVTGLLRNNSTIANTLLSHPEVQKALAEGNVDSLYVYEPVYITVTPTPDGKTYFAGEYQNGTRQLAHPFSWYRSDVNLPNNNLKISANVYDYRIFSSFHYQDLDITDAIGQGYIEQKPQSDNDEFLFIFASIYEDEVISAKTPNVWLPTQTNFAIQINNTAYYPVTYPYQIRMRELEQLTTQKDDSFIQAFGQNREYQNIHTSNNELYNNGTPIDNSQSVGYGGFISNTHYFIQKGSSNMEDGYILFEIPKNTPIDNIKVLGQFFSFGNAQWILTNINDKTNTNGGYINVQ